MDAGEGRTGRAVDAAESVGGAVGRRCGGREGVYKDCRGGLWRRAEREGGAGGRGGTGGVKSEGNRLVILRRERSWGEEVIRAAYAVLYGVAQ